MGNCVTSPVSIHLFLTLMQESFVYKSISPAKQYASRGRGALATPPLFSITHDLSVSDCAPSILPMISFNFISSLHTSTLALFSRWESGGAGRPASFSEVSQPTISRAENQTLLAASRPRAFRPTHTGGTHSLSTPRGKVSALRIITVISDMCSHD